MDILGPEHTGGPSVDGSSTPVAPELTSNLQNGEMMCSCVYPPSVGAGLGQSACPEEWGLRAQATARVARSHSEPSRGFRFG